MDRKAERVFYDVVLEDLAQVRQFVRETAVSQGYDPTAIGEFFVAVNEAVVNIIQHGYQNSPGSITVMLTSSPQSLTVTLLDNAPSFDPTIVASPDITLPLAERPFGGIGVHIMREFCDKIHYQRNAHDKNELTLIKYV